MRTLSWIVIGLAVTALIAGGGFLLYLNWAFTPRNPSGGPPSETRRTTKVGEAGGGMFFSISELRSASNEDVIYDVTLAWNRGAAQKNEGDIAVRAVNSPIPVNVTRPEPRIVEVEFDRKIDPSGATGLRIPIQAEPQMIVRGWLFFENGVPRQ